PITTLIGTKPTDKKESYVFICRFKELPYLISDLFMQGYAKHKPYYCYVNGFWYSYFTKESYELALDEGLTKIKKDGWIKNFEFEYKSLVNKSSDFKIDLDKTKKLTKSKINEFFDYLKLLLQYYYPLDHFFTDKAFAESEKNKSLRPAVNKMGELKNFFREKLNEIVLYPNNMTQQYLQRISENYNVPFESLYLYSAEEIGKIPEGFRLSRKEIQGRSTKYAMYYDGEKSHYYSEKEADKIIEEIHEEPISDNVLKGIPANKGKITAKARVLEYTLNTLKDFGKIENLIKSMQKGEILVTETTGPEIMKACNKAIAIITDEGGLLSHAAIIARELKIPCIVGTKFATSTIKTGDLIEVDANKGIIKILKKNETEKKFFFEKEVTRDLALLAIEGFGPALINIYNKLKGIYPTSPFMIFYTKALLVEEWVDSDLLKEFVELIYLENLKGSIFLEQYIVNYKKHLDFYKDTNITSLKELQKYLHSLYFALESFIIFYFTAGDNRTPKPILQLAKQIRNTDNLGEVSDKVVRSALKNIFPHTTGYETVISSNDLSNMPTINVLKERAKQFLFIPGKFAETISLQDFSHNHPEYHFHIETPPADSSMLTGQIGNKGYVKGKVRIVNRKKEIDSVQDGEILVSTMTTPDFLPAMQKAAAFITDEGGITCHAAIMAREFNKPCIIGTKFATQILKDGDMVEVDADNGIVKILEKETNKTIFDPTTIDWFKVMERKNLFFVGLAFTDVETEKFKQVCGFQLQRYLFKYEKGMWSTYRGIQEHSELYNYFSQLIKKRDKRLFEFAKQAKKFNDLAKKYISAYSLNKNVKIDNYEKEYNLYCDTLLYGVTIPWAVLGAFETMTPTERKIYSDILNLYEPFRAESLYPDFEKRILQKYRVALSKRYNLDINLLYLLTPWELKNALKGIFIPRKEILKKRNEYCIYWFNPITKEIIFSHDKSIEKKITILQKASVENAEIIKGTVAYPGIVSGNVRIIYEAIDCADFKQNEILVSPSTNPTLMPAIKKCAGIITDEGGMTSHAAIIARELKKPCIIGTRIATQILKDGMEVEVDADNG
ncbi:MAG: PEP-utilizing enzyme, partial [archaeon]|nr:PEP-utilizing enzyme [archaeon]